MIISSHQKNVPFLKYNAAIQICKYPVWPVKHVLPLVANTLSSQCIHCWNHRQYFPPPVLSNTAGLRLNEMSEICKKHFFNLQIKMNAQQNKKSDTIFNDTWHEINIFKQDNSI